MRQQLWDQQGENTLWRKCWEIWVTQAQTWEGWMLRFLSGGFKILVQSVSFLSCFAMKESSSVQVDVLLWNSYSPDHLCRGLHLLHLWASLQHNLVFEPTSPCTIPAFLFLFSSLFPNCAWRFQTWSTLPTWVLHSWLFSFFPHCK